MFAAALSSSPALPADRLVTSPAGKRVALVLSCLMTAALFSLFVVVSAGKLRDVHSAGGKFVVTSIELTEQIRPEPADEADDAPSGSPGRFSESAQSTAPVTIAPISALPVPLETIRLAPLAQPHASLATDHLAPTASTEAQSFQAQFAKPSAGSAEVGDTGTGTGEGMGAGAGGGAGSGAQQRIIFVASWAPSMDFAKGREFYPPAAIKSGIEGVAVLRCFVMRRDRVRDCKLVDENPRNQGFGEAALLTAPHLRIRLHDQNGRRVYNQWVTVSNWFDLSEETRHQLGAASGGEDIVTLQ
jgi:hypothetical protein